MKVLFIAGQNTGAVPAFVSEQAEQLRRRGISVDLFGIVGHGTTGYLLNLPRLLRVLEEGRYDVVHAHYGLSALLAILQMRAPVVVTFHGSDLYRRDHRMLSRIARLRCRCAIYVSTRMHSLLPPRRSDKTIPCTIDYELFKPLPRAQACRRLGWDVYARRVLFAGSFDREVKNAPLAHAAVDRLTQSAQLVELAGYDRQGVCDVMNACDVLLLTSLSEGSPQVVKEALACGLPIVSVDVGDVAEQIEGVAGCAICPADPHSIAQALSLILEAPFRVVRTNRQLDGLLAVDALVATYREVIGLEQ